MRHLFSFVGKICLYIDLILHFKFLILQSHKGLIKKIIFREPITQISKLAYRWKAEWLSFNKMNTVDISDLIHYSFRNLRLNRGLRFVYTYWYLPVVRDNLPCTGFTFKEELATPIQKALYIYIYRKHYPRPISILPYWITSPCAGN